MSAARSIDELGGRVAIVTGAGRGIGRATAKALAAAGARVVLGGRPSDKADDGVEAVAKEIKARGGEAVDVTCDVSLESDVERLVGAAIDAFGRIDVLVNNAAVFKPYVSLAEIRMEDWDETFDVNLRAPLLCIRAVVPHMKAEGGNIVNVSSAAGDAAYRPARAKTDGAYTVSKAALTRMTLWLVDELAPYDIVVTAVSPDGLQTEGTAELWGVPLEEVNLDHPDAIGPMMVYLAKPHKPGELPTLVRRSGFQGDGFATSLRRPDVFWSAAEHRRRLGPARR